jgi:hypothetical protein
MRFFWVFGASLALLSGLGCAGPATSDLGAVPRPSASPQGIHPNGLHLNGLHLNGPDMNGVHLDGLPLEGLAINGHHVAISLDGGRIVRADGDPDLTGATITAAASDGSPVILRIDAIAASSMPDARRYAVSFARPPSASFEPLCGAVDGEPVLAIPLSGAWDESTGARVDAPTRFTFACEGYALAKCVELGYAPWRRATECRAPGDCRVVQLSSHHQACTRMLRADYCGDGTSTTRDGTLVDLWDALGLQQDEAPSWPFEAEWTTAGAACVTTTRWPTLEGEGALVESFIHDHCPERWQAPGCGGPASTFFASNGLALPPAARVLLRTRVMGSP